MKPNPQQEALLESITEAKDAMLKEKRHFAVEAAQMLKDRLEEHEREISRRMNSALAAGVSKTRIGRAYGTTNWETVSQLMELTEDERRLAPKATAPGVTGTTKVKPYSINLPDNGRSTVTINVYADGSIRPTPLVIEIHRHQAASLSDDSYRWFRLDETELGRGDLINQIEDDLRDRIRRGKWNKMDGVRIVGLTDPLPPVVVSSGPEPGSPEWLRAIEEEEDRWLDAAD